MDRYGVWHIIGQSLLCRTVDFGGGFGLEIDRMALLILPMNETLQIREEVMKFQIQLQRIDWWFWAVTLFLIVAAVWGWAPGYYLVILISGLQVLYFWYRGRSLSDFDTQVRIVYFAFTLLGLFGSIRLPFYLILLLGTVLVVFFDRCGIALVLKYMPWNRRGVVRIQDRPPQVE